MNTIYKELMIAAFLKRRKEDGAAPGAHHKAMNEVWREFAVVCNNCNGRLCLSVSLHCVSMWDTVSRVLQVLHRCLSCLWKIKEWVEEVCPIRNRDKTFSSSRIFREDNDHAPIVILMSCNCVRLSARHCRSKKSCNIAQRRPDWMIVGCYNGYIWEI